MRKLLNWLGFGGKFLTAISTSIEPLIPAWDDMKAKNKAIDDQYAIDHPELLEEVKNG